MVGKNQRNRRQERTDWKHRDFKVVDESELLIENPIEIKSKKNRRQAESIVSIFEGADRKSD